MTAYTDDLIVTAPNEPLWPTRRLQLSGERGGANIELGRHGRRSGDGLHRCEPIPRVAHHWPSCRTATR
jgi:hypothetical protein